MLHAVLTDNLGVRLGHAIALDGVSVALGRGQITGLIGPSGAGKTTFIRTLVGRQGATTGRVTVLGKPAGSAELRGKIGYMTQASAVYADLTVAENIRYFAAMSATPAGQAGDNVAEVLATVDLTRQHDHLVGNLSGGQRQRVSLAAALVGQPQLLILDEPTVGLDPVLRAELWHLFYNLTSRGVTIILSSHDMDEARRCDDLVLIRDGMVLAHDTPSRLQKTTGTSSVETAFLKLVEAVR